MDTLIKPTIIMVNGIYYTLNHDAKTAKVTRYGNAYAGPIVIPKSISFNGETFTVITIEERNFCFQRITSVIIPDSMLFVGDYAFSNCYCLTSVTIPSSVIYIGEHAFNSCIKLKSVNISKSVRYIAGTAFSCNRELEEITIDPANKKYDSRDGCNAIIKTASNKLITGCKTTIIPDNIVHIGPYAFNECPGLTSVFIPRSVTTIGAGAFNDCSGLIKITVDPHNKTYDSRENCNAIIRTATNKLTAGCKSTVIPNSVTSIGDYAFMWCSELTSVDISYVTSIGDYAFSDCTGLASIKIPNSVTHIGLGAFTNCDRLSSVNIPDSVTHIRFSTFRSCSRLASVTIGCSVVYIGDEAFMYCSNLTSITIPSSVKSIGEFAFGECQKLIQIKCLGVKPPKCNLDAFFKVDKSKCKLIVPKESIGLYRAARGWKDFKHISAIKDMGKGD